MPARADGSCFYSAVYRSAAAQPTVLEKICKIFEIKGENETDFIQGVSSAASDSIRGCVYRGLKEYYKGKAEPEINETFFERIHEAKQISRMPIKGETSYENETDDQFDKRMREYVSQKEATANVSFYTEWRKESSAELLAAFPPDETEFKKKYPKTNDGEIAFYKAVADILDTRKDGTFVYASEIDVGVVRLILRVNNIMLLNAIQITDIRKEAEKDMPTLWLKHLVGTHYDYYIKN